jgi:hypothetical protein
MTDGLRVLTMNLLAPQKGDYQRRRPVLAEGLGRLRPGRRRGRGLPGQPLTAGHRP